MLVCEQVLKEELLRFRGEWQSVSEAWDCPSNSCVGFKRLFVCFLTLPRFLTESISLRLLLQTRMLSDKMYHFKKNICQHWVCVDGAELH